MTTLFLRSARWALLMQAVLCLGLSTSLAAQESSPDPSRDAQIPTWMRRWSRTHQRSSPAVLAAFRDVVHEPRNSTVSVLCGGQSAALGTIISSDGLVLTKASELSGAIQCELSDGRILPAAILTIEQDLDLAVVKIQAEGLKAIDWNDQQVPAVGSWLATPGLGTDPLAIGVVSAACRPIRAPRAILGVQLDQASTGAKIVEVLPESSAQRAGLLAEDRIIKLNGKSVSAESLMEELSRFRPGDQIKLAIQRGDTQLETAATLTDLDTTPGGRRVNQQKGLGRELSRRNAGFPSALQHDTVLKPSECGGPLVDLDGRAVGINIASSDRVATLALPAAVVMPLVNRLKAERSPAVANAGG